MAKPDLYLKMVLTIIAFALLWVGYALNSKSVEATGPTPVIITGIQFGDGSHAMPVGIAATNWRDGAWQHDALPVAVTNQPTVAIAKERKSEPAK